MKPEKALDLVLRYSLHVKNIKRLTAEIGNSIDFCKGIDGNRKEVDRHGCLIHQPDLDNKGRDKKTHLWNWYQINWYNPVDDEVQYQKITSEIHQKECPHCYAAHIAVQKTQRTSQ